jgi:hypothetical protein
MTLTPELTEALCGFCGDVATMENNVDLIDCIEDHYIDDETEEPAKVLDTLKALRNLKRDMTEILKAMRKAERI